MITLDALRTALLAPDPYDGIDRLIRAELATGRKTAAIHDELLALVKPVRATPGLTGDAEEALFGALDGLTGSCHPDSAYQDPPEPSAAPAVPSANPVGDILTPPTTPKNI
jgi:hypothetical protein